ncbi:MAG: hypothetical protein U0M42_03215 [Acutalibacteraceae bacterium]|nr:hypothetical protein [Acutalibacteraceae bacterium]
MAIGQNTKVKAFLKTFFKLTITELVILLTVKPSAISFIPIFERFFASLNSFLIPAFTSEDNFIQKIIAFFYNLITSLDFLCVIIELALYLIPLCFLVTLVIVLPISEIARKLKINRVIKKRTAQQKPVRKTNKVGFSDSVSLFKAISLKRDLKKLQDETFFSLELNDNGCIRVQKMSLENNFIFSDRLLNWNVNGKALYSDADEDVTLSFYTCDGSAFLCLGDKEYPLTMGVPFRVDKDKDEDDSYEISYIVTWIGDEQ